MVKRRVRVPGWMLVMVVSLMPLVSVLRAGMYGRLRAWLSERAAVIGATLYLFAPYHLVDLEFRVDIGELTAMMWLPLLLMAGERRLVEKQAGWLWLLATSVAGLVLSHQAVALIGLPVVGIYGIWRLLATKRSWWQGVGAVLMGLGMSVWYWLPVLYEGQFTHQADLARQVVFPATRLYL